MTREYFRRGINLYNYGRFDESIIELDKAIFLYNNEDAHMCAIIQNTKGLALGALQRYEDAKTCFDKAIGFDPNFDAAYHNRGYTYGNLGKYNEAIEDFRIARKCLRNPTGNLDLLYILRNEGYAYAMLGKEDEAIQCLECALKGEGVKFAYGWNTKGFIHTIFGSYEEANNCFIMATKINPTFALAWRNKGYALYSLERINDTQDKSTCQECLMEALTCFDKAIQFDPDSPYSWHYKGYVHFYLKEYSEAVRCFQNAVELKPDLAESWISEGMSLYADEKYKDAMICFDFAIRLLEVEDRKEGYSADEEKNDDEKKLADSWYNKGLSLDACGQDSLNCFEKAIYHYKNYASYKGRTENEERAD